MKLPKWMHSALDMLFQNKEGEFLSAARDGHPRILKGKLAEGVDVDARFSNGSTALMAASLRGHVSVVQILLRQGADVNACNNAGRTALHCAAVKGHLAIIEMLLEHNSNHDRIDKMGETPASYVAFLGNLEAYQLLLAKGTRSDGIDIIFAAAMDDSKLLSARLEAGATRIRAGRVLKKSRSSVFLAAAGSSWGASRVAFSVVASCLVAQNRWRVGFPHASRSCSRLSGGPLPSRRSSSFKKLEL